MKLLGNLIYDKPLVNQKTVNYINYVDYNHTKDFDSNLPTMVVGWKLLKTIYKESPCIQEQSILDKVVKENKLYWEFSFNENKSQHVSGVEMFIHNAPIYYFHSNFEYNLIDPVSHNIIMEEHILDFFPDRSVDGIYIYRDTMIYILKDNNIFGIDIGMFSFFEIQNIKSFILSTLILKNPESLYDDLSGDLFTKYNEIFSGYDYLKRYLIILLSK